MVQMVKNLTAMQETWVRSLGWGDPLEKGMVTHSSILDWRIPWTEETGGSSPWGCKQSDTAEQLRVFSIYRIVSWRKRRMNGMQTS